MHVRVGFAIGPGDELPASLEVPNSAPGTSRRPKSTGTFGAATMVSHEVSVHRSFVELAKCKIVLLSRGSHEIDDYPSKNT